MSHTSSSSRRRRRVALLAVAFVLGSAFFGFANAGQDRGANVASANARANFTVDQKHEVASIEPSHSNEFVQQIPSQKPWPAPIGHHQPRLSDVTADASVNLQLSSSEAEEQRLDRELKAKLIICRGC